MNRDRGARDFADGDDVWSTPRDAPTYPRFPIQFRECEVLSLQYRTDAQAIARLLPAPLEPTSDVVLINVAQWGDVPGLGRDLNECNVMVGARFRGPRGSVTGAYSPYFFLDNDRAIALGREVQGQPKRFATISLEDRGDLHVGVVRSNGIDVVTGTLPYRPERVEPEAMRAHIDMRTNINLKVIPNIDGTIALRQLVSRVLADVKITECWTGPCTVEIRPNAGAPIHRLPVLSFLEGYIWRGSFSLVGGTVLHDYLAPPAQ